MARMTEVIKVRIPIFMIRPAQPPVTFMLLLPSQDQATEEQGSVVFDDIMKPILFIIFGQIVIKISRRKELYKYYLTQRES